MADVKRSDKPQADIIDAMNVAWDRTLRTHDLVPLGCGLFRMVKR